MAQASFFYGVGLATLTTGGRVLDVWYPQPQATDEGLRSSGVANQADVSDLLQTGHAGTIQLPRDAAEKLLGLPLNTALGRDELRQVDRVAVLSVIPSLGDPPVDAYDAYLRLHLLSHRRVVPHQPNLEGLFGLLSNVVWTSLGPCPVEDFESVRLRAHAAGHAVQVHSLDKFPRMTDYVIPSGVRIADADRVRLGAHLADGTTVMHEGFVNFNAGTLGASMVEGRISAGVVVDDGSDIGGGASIMGTLSGGGKEIIRVGKRCLIGANGGIGISLGDDCVVEAGLYVTAGTRISLPDGRTVKGAELTGRSGLLYRRNSTTGVVEALPRSPDAGVSLNTELHSHN